MTEPTTRRSVLRGVLLVLVAGAGGYAVAATSGAADPKRATTAANDYGYGPAPQGRLLARLAQIPAGGGLVVAGASVVLTRDAGGAVHGFSSTCTHQGCTVSAVAGGTIDCPCHGSRFDASTGAVVAGPAPRPLPAVPVEVRGDAVYTRGAS